MNPVCLRQRNLKPDRSGKEGHTSLTYCVLLISDSRFHPKNVRRKSCDTFRPSLHFKRRALKAAMSKLEAFYLLAENTIRGWQHRSMML